MSNKTTKQTHVLTGTPSEIGAEVFAKFCLPALREASKLGSAQNLASMYTGFIGSAFGAMVADFGLAAALEGAEKMVEQFRNFDPDAADKTTPKKH